MAIEHAQRKPHLTQQAHELIRGHFEKWRMRPNVAIDATCGNGNDTLYLAELSNQVFAFDVQAQALAMTRKKLSAAGIDDKVQLIHSGHEHIDRHISAEVDCIMFNLGYLPKADKSVTTQTDTTLSALNTSLQLLNKGCGLLSILCYPGHPEGKTETEAVKTWLEELSDNWKVTKVLSNHPNERAPILFLVIPSTDSSET